MARSVRLIDRYCFWSVATGRYGPMLQHAVDSARAVGVFKDFHVWTDRPIEGARVHRLKKFDARKGLFRLHLLADEVRKLKYEYFVWLDADSYFVRNPGDVLRVLHGAPVHASLESDAATGPHVEPDWERCSMSNFTKLMRFCGVRSRSIFTVDGGFWILHREAVEHFSWLAWDFSDFTWRAGYRFGFGPLLAYAMQMLCGNPYAHRLRDSADLWAVDRSGASAAALPHGQDWFYQGGFTGERFAVNPAIVHAPHSHRRLAERGRRRAARDDQEVARNPGGAAGL